MTTPSMKALSAIIGEHTATMLCDRLGGCDLYIPLVPIKDSPLVLAIGHAAAARICDRYSGQHLCIPSRQSVQSARRRADIVFDLRRGQSPREIAWRHGLTARQVRNIRRSLETSP